ncbi:MAG: hypothetical protein GY729_02240, partial [Desulfobacteraceae bacterium]|nr:hypothetical protein [Desulfobacteraceae bacterium]
MMDDDNIYKHLARHMSMAGVVYTDNLVEILQETFSKEEAKIAMLLPANHIPLQAVSIETLACSKEFDAGQVEKILEDL